MIDTLKIGIPLSPKQYERIRDIALSADREQWTLFNPCTGELRFSRVLGLAETDQNSFHRELRWDIPGSYIPEKTYLYVELSLPKLWYGHNVHLLHEWIAALDLLRRHLIKQFNLGRLRLARPLQWSVFRADLCYAWRFPSQEIAQAYLDSLKRLHYPRKQPVIRRESIMFVGATYSVKFYLKLPEYRNHDLKALVKQGASLDWVNLIEDKARGVLRYEVTLRRRYLKREGINTVYDLQELDQKESACKFDSLTEEILSKNEKLRIPFIRTVTLYGAASKQLHTIVKDGQEHITIKSGDSVNVPPVSGLINNEFGSFRGCKITYNLVSKQVAILRRFLLKFVGDIGMQLVDKVKAKLKERYKPVKAARLVSMWLYVQRFGTELAKEEFGRDSFYRAKRDMKAAGVSLLEAKDSVVTLDPGFFQDFKLEVPSYYVTNQWDDHRDGDNLLNLKAQ